MPFIESVIVAVTIEVGSRGYDWLKEIDESTNAPLRAARRATENSEVTVDELQNAFVLASEGHPRQKFVTRHREEIIEDVAEELETTSSLDIDPGTLVEKYLKELENRLVSQEGSGHEILLEYLREIESDLSDLRIDLEHAQYYRAFPASKSDKAIKHLKSNLGLIDTFEYVQRPEVTDDLSIKHLIIGRKGSGKSRTLLYHAIRRINRKEIGTILVPSTAVQRYEDLRAALTRNYEEDVLVVWDDIHSINRPKRNNAFYNFILKLDKSLDKNQNLHVIATCRSEELVQLQHYDYWNEDRVWSEFERTHLKPIGGETLETLIKRAIDAYNLDFKSGAKERFRKIIEFGNPSPFYIASACYFLAEKKDEDPKDHITNSDIVDIPSYGAEIWEEQYSHVCREMGDSRYILMAIKLLNQFTNRYDRGLVKGIFTEVYNRELFDFDQALQSLIDSQWIISGEANESLIIHDIQIAGIQDETEQIFDEFAKFLLNSASNYIEYEELIKIWQLAIIQNLYDPSFVHESTIETTSEELLNREFFDKISPKYRYMSFLNYGAFLHSEEQPTKALNYSTKAIQTFPSKTNSYLNHAIFAASADAHKVAEASYRQALKFCSEEPDNIQVQVRVNFAKYLGSLGREDEAVEMFEKALDTSENDSKVYQEFSNYLERIGEIGSARKLHEMAMKEEESLETKVNYAEFLLRFGPEDRFDEVKNDLLRTTPEHVKSIHDVFSYVRNTQRWLNIHLENQPIESSLEEQAHDIAEEKGLESAIVWLQEQSNNSESPSLYATLGAFWIDLGNMEDAVKAFEQGIELAFDLPSPQVGRKLTEGCCNTLENVEEPELARSLCDFALDQIKIDSKESFRTRDKLLRFKLGLSATNDRISLEIPYHIARYQIFRGDLENALNSYLEVWQRRNILGDDNEIGIKFGIQAGVMLTAMMTKVEITGGDVPLDKIRQYVEDHIEGFDEDVKWLYAEAQHQFGEADPICSREEIPETEWVVPNELAIYENEFEHSNLERDDKAVFQCMLTLVQNDFNIEQVVC